MESASIPEKRKPGRPLGSASKMAKEAREKAQQTGLLPHEWLLSVMRGELQEQLVVDPIDGKLIRTYIVPDFEKRIDAGKAAAPYYAPKISTVEVITGVSDDELDAIIAGAAAEAEVSLSANGEGETAEREEATRVRERRRVG